MSSNQPITDFDGQISLENRGLTISGKNRLLVCHSLLNYAPVTPKHFNRKASMARSKSKQRLMRMKRRQHLKARKKRQKTARAAAKA
jgi:hypothetical protein